MDGDIAVGGRASPSARHSLAPGPTGAQGGDSLSAHHSLLPCSPRPDLQLVPLTHNSQGQPTEGAGLLWRLAWGEAPRMHVLGGQLHPPGSICPPPHFGADNSESCGS